MTIPPEIYTTAIASMFCPSCCSIYPTLSGDEPCKVCECEDGRMTHGADATLTIPVYVQITPIDESTREVIRGAITNYRQPY